jgi:hypothetical protein
MQNKVLPNLFLSGNPALWSSTWGKRTDVLVFGVSHVAQGGQMYYTLYNTLNWGTIFVHSPPSTNALVKSSVTVRLLHAVTWGTINPIVIICSSNTILCILTCVNFHRNLCVIRLE